VLFVSHDMTAIGRLASRSVVVESGRIRFIGPTPEAVRLYLSSDHSTDGGLRARTDRTGDGIIRMVGVAVRDRHGADVSGVDSGDPVTIAVDYESRMGRLDPDALMLDMRVRDAMGHPIVTFSTRFTGLECRGSLPGCGTLLCHIPSLALAEEIYSLDLWMSYRRGCADSVSRVADVRVGPGRYFETGYAPVKRKHGAALMQHQWSAAATEPAVIEAVS
jgi:hypothetical protein